MLSRVASHYPHLPHRRCICFSSPHQLPPRRSGPAVHQTLSDDWCAASCVGYGNGTFDLRYEEQSLGLHARAAFKCPLVDNLHNTFHTTNAILRFIAAPPTITTLHSRRTAANTQPVQSLGFFDFHLIQGDPNGPKVLIETLHLLVLHRARLATDPSPGESIVSPPGHPRTYPIYRTQQRFYLRNCDTNPGTQAVQLETSSAVLRQPPAIEKGQLREQQGLAGSQWHENLHHSR